MQRVIKLTVFLFVPYFAFLFYLVWRGAQFRASLPRWVWVVMLFYFVGGVLGAGLSTRRRVQSSAETTRRSRALSHRRLLKGALLLYVLIFLNAVVLLARRRVPVELGILGSAVDLSLIAVFVWILICQGNGKGPPS